MMHTSPSVTVLLPVYNDAEHIHEAVESVLAQTFTDFELLIVDDGSIDGTRDILDSFEDPRIRVLPNEGNRGLPYSLNRGLSEARAPFVARMDSDDVCLPERLSAQVEYLSTHPQVGACGSWIETFGRGEEEVWAYPEASEDVKTGLLFRPTLAHPSVMLRKNTFDEAGLEYDQDFRSSEDYDLWVRAAEVVRLANVPKILLRYRLPPLSANKDVIKELYADRVRQRLLESLGLQPTIEELALHGCIGRCETGPGVDWLQMADAWLTRLAMANKVTSTYDENVLLALFSDRFWRLCWDARSFGPEVWRIFWESDWRAGARVPYGMMARFWLQTRISKAGSMNRCP